MLAFKGRSGDDDCMSEALSDYADQPNLDAVDVAATDPVRMYLNQIGKVPLLTAEQEVMIARRIEVGVFAGQIVVARAGLLSEAQDAGRVAGIAANEADYPSEDLRYIAQDGAAARNQLISANLRLVVSLAKRYTRSGMPLLDLIQEGNLGLVRAVEKFDYTTGNKFSTYATWWIRQAIQRGIADKGRVIRLPVHVAEQEYKISRVKRTLDDKGMPSEPEDIARELDITPEKAKHLLKVGQSIVSLDKPVNGLSGDSGEAFGDFLPDKTTDTARAAEQVVMNEVLEKVLDKYLSPREAEIIRLRYGLYDGDQWTYDAIGKKFNIDRTRVSQILTKGMLKLGKPEVLAYFDE